MTKQRTNRKPRSHSSPGTRKTHENLETTDPPSRNLRKRTLATAISLVKGSISSKDSDLKQPENVPNTKRQRTAPAHEDHQNASQRPNRVAASRKQPTPQPPRHPSKSATSDQDPQLDVQPCTTRRTRRRAHETRKKPARSSPIVSSSPPTSSAYPFGDESYRRHCEDPQASERRDPPACLVLPRTIQPEQYESSLRSAFKKMVLERNPFLKLLR
jgi:hypothetical protein